MSSGPVEILRCPAELRAEALSLVLCELAPSLRREVAGGLLNTDEIEALSVESLFIARRGDRLCGAAWGHLGFSIGYTTIALSSEDGERQVVICANGVDLDTDAFWDAAGQLAWRLYCM